MDPVDRSAPSHVPVIVWWIAMLLLAVPTIVAGVVVFVLGIGIPGRDHADAIAPVLVVVGAILVAAPFRTMFHARSRERRGGWILVQLALIVVALLLTFAIAFDGSHFAVFTPGYSDTCDVCLNPPVAS